MAGLKDVLIAADQLANALIGGCPDETISARAWRLRQRPAWGVTRHVIDTLFWFDPSHCESSYQSEFYRNQLPAEYRGKNGNT